MRQRRRRCQHRTDGLGWWLGWGFACAARIPGGYSADAAPAFPAQRCPGLDHQTAVGYGKSLTRIPHVPEPVADVEQSPRDKVVDFITRVGNNRTENFFSDFPDDTAGIIP